MKKEIFSWLVVCCWTGIGILQSIELDKTLMIVLASVTFVLAICNMIVITKKND